MYVLNENIHRLRKERGMTQEELAKLVGVSKSTISNYENDMTRPACSKLSKIADALGVTVPELFEGISRNYGFDETPQYTKMLNEIEKNDGKVKSPRTELVISGIPYVYLYEDENGDTVIVTASDGSHMIFGEYSGEKIITEYDDTVYVVDTRSKDREQLIVGSAKIGEIIGKRKYNLQ